VSLVLDASVALAWFIDGQVTAATERVLDDVSQAGAMVPALWRIEVGNALLVAGRRGRLSPARRAEVIAILGAMPVSVDEAGDLEAWGACLVLADLHGLTLYDATYLELALRSRLPLATLDEKLKLAAAAEGVTLLA
jgi:predicted nucleic acid-binding protein